MSVVVSRPASACVVMQAHEMPVTAFPTTKSRRTQKKIDRLAHKMAQLGISPDPKVALQQQHMLYGAGGTATTVLIPVARPSEKGAGSKSSRDSSLAAQPASSLVVAQAAPELPATHPFLSTPKKELTKEERKQRKLIKKLQKKHAKLVGKAGKEALRTRQPLQIEVVSEPLTSQPLPSSAPTQPVYALPVEPIPPLTVRPGERPLPAVPTNRQENEELPAYTSEPLPGHMGLRG
ncbi:hypothetical protein HDU96_006319 [Phlyctochytrium bullatum]|nr:hypothetical protein HDU96_006319 [Phlyctochytrium bullatum]